MSTTNVPLEKLQSYIGQYYIDTPSSFGKWLNPFIVKAEHGKLEVQYTVRMDMTNPLGNLHGGVIAAIIDEVTGATVFSTGQTKFFTTLNLQVDFFSPAHFDETITVKTELIKEGRQFFNVECKIYNKAGRLIARGQSNLFRTNEDVIV